MPANLGLQGNGETFCTSTPQKVRIDVPDFDIFVWAEGLQDMLPRNPHGAEAYVRYDQPTRSSSICNTAHHEVKVAQSRQTLQSRDVSKCPSGQHVRKNAQGTG